MTAHAWLLSALLGAPAWTGANTALTAAVAAEAVYDVLSTRYCLTEVQGHAGHYCREQNPLLGQHPGALRLYGSATAGLVAFGLVSYFLPHPWREVFQFMTLGIETTNIALFPAEMRFHVAF